MDCVKYHTVDDQNSRYGGEVTLSAEQMLVYLRRFNDLHVIGFSSSLAGCPLFEILDGLDVPVIAVANTFTVVKPHPGDTPKVTLKNSSDCMAFVNAVDSEFRFHEQVTVGDAREILEAMTRGRESK